MDGHAQVRERKERHELEKRQRNEYDLLRWDWFRRVQEDLLDLQADLRRKQKFALTYLGLLTLPKILGRARDNVAELRRRRDIYFA